MGFKISANDRDAIQDIKKMAGCREFDILVILYVRQSRKNCRLNIFDCFLSQPKRNYGVLLYRGRNQREGPHKQVDNGRLCNRPNHFIGTVYYMGCKFGIGSRLIILSIDVFSRLQVFDNSCLVIFGLFLISARTFI